MTSTVPVATQPTVRRHVDALDGIRAIAILMVLAFHFKWAGVPFHAGGFLGVDAFFVLSGFLITSLLLDERRRTHRVSMRGFYLRRALRLVPVAAVLLAIGVAVFVVAPESYNWRPQPIAFVAYVGVWINWLDVWRPEAGGVLAHAWSLAIEAQFYFVWPPLLVLARARGVRLRYVAGTVFALIGLALALRISAWSAAPPAVPASAPGVTRYLVGLGRGAAWSRWYFGSFTHMDGLLLGALTAIVLTRSTVRAFLARHRVGAQVACAVGGLVAAAVVVEASRRGISGFVPVWGLLPFEIGVAVVVAVLVTVPRSAPGRVLGCAPMVWIGRRSYAMYMLHISVWMLVVHFGLGRSDSGDATLMAWLALALTFVVAELSFRFVETPALRLKRRFSAPR
jgi:peptidoglycan/LPS O-acetylase OafA/YrhL